MKFSVNLLPARYGDCIWIEYGDKDNLHRILIDGGTSGTKEEINTLLLALPVEKRTFDLMIVTHIDKDHIEGVLNFIEKHGEDFQVKDFWFNGWKHLPDQAGVETFGSKQGERLTAAIIKHKFPWNSAFGHQAVVIPDTDILPVINLAGGLKLTLLSPTIKNLQKLKPVWAKEVLDAGLIPGFGSANEEAPEDKNDVESFGDQIPDINSLNNVKFTEDTAEANGSSLALLAEYGGKKVLLLGDAQPSLVEKSLRSILNDGKFTVDLCKISHHASRGNTSPDLIEFLACKNYLISTNGAIFGHPHRETIARLIKKSSSGSHLMFNYRTAHNKVWDMQSLKVLHNYSTAYSESGNFKFDLL